MIELKNLCKNIGQTPILKNVNLHIKKGEFVAIVGQSGSGKTSLLNIIGTLDEPSSGSYIFENYEVTTLNTSEKSKLRREKIGFIFQRYNLLNLLSASENVALPAVYAGISANERNERARKILADLGLENKIHSKPNELSGGQQQRVSIARALMNGGDLILADEPTGALDSKSGEMVLEILQELNAQGHTIILVTHDSNIAAKARRIIEIKDGQIIKDSKATVNLNPKNLSPMPKEVKNYNLLKNQITECLKIAYSSIIAYKLRSLLTMLGIIIGIASVVSVVALGLGSQKQVFESISRLGTNTIEVHSGRGLGDIRSGRVNLNLSDLYTLQELPQLESVEAQDATSGIATYGNVSLNARMEGGGVNMFNIRGLTLTHGRIFNAEEVKSGDNVAVLDSNGQNRLFAGLNPEQILNKTIIFGKQPFKIIGILAKDSRRPDSDVTVRIYAPYTTLKNKITGSRSVRQIVAKVKDEANPSLAEEAMIRTLELKRGQKDFFTINSDSIKQSIEENTKTFTLLISSIAIIALVVGGIGVMNIMIVSVSERTREIGIRMAIGARKEDILLQFLIEAIMICIIGAILGVVLSFVVVFLFNTFSADFLMIISGGSVILGLVSSVLIGLIFGFSPAKNAANLNPINALSKE